MVLLRQIEVLMSQGKARQGKARQGKARQGKARQGKARQGKARQGKADSVPRSRNFAAELRDECLSGEIFYSLKEATVVIEQWRNQYNTIRPHSSLNYRPPAHKHPRPYRCTWIAVTRCISLYSAGPKYPLGHFFNRIKSKQNAFLRELP